MERPHVSVDNPAVYEYYSNLPANADFMRKFHHLAATVLHSQRIFLPGSREAIGQHVEQGKPALILVGHATWLDPGFGSGVLDEEPELSPLIANFVIPANAPYFNKPFFGWLFDQGGAIPAFRPKDVHGKDEVITEESLESARILAREKLAEICIANIENNKSVIMFNEGTRNAGDRKKVQRSKTTPQTIVRKISSPEDLMVISIMPYYGNKKYKNLFRPVIAIGHIDPSKTQDLDKRDMQQFQQICLDTAVNVYESRKNKGLFGLFYD